MRKELLGVGAINHHFQHWLRLPPYILRAQLDSLKFRSGIRRILDYNVHQSHVVMGQDTVQDRGLTVQRGQF